MNKGLIGLVVGAFLLTAAAPALLWAQGAAPPAAAPQTPPQVVPAYSQAELDQLLAPIALYPDTLLGQILMASTYPLEVVEAYRWTQEPTNARLQGDQLAAAIQDKDWDPSVKSLIPFPQVLQMMNDRLDWTQRLGNAFLAQEADVMDSVQRLRRAAEAAGSLKSSSQEVVTTTADQAIVIAPADPVVVYVPVYDPTVVYGVWPYPAYPPYYYWPPRFVYAEPYWPGFWWWPAIQIGFWGAYWGWGNFDWHNHYIYVDHNRYDRIAGHRPPFSGNTWQHDSYHRRGVAYRDPGTAARYGRPAASPGARGSYRGYDRTPAAAPAGRPGTPSTRQPVTRQPSGAPTSRQPITRQPSGTPSTRQPVTRPPSGAPATRQPVTQQPSATPSTRQPVTRQPSATPSTRQPVTRQAPSVQRGGTTVQPRTPPAFGGYGQGSDVRTQSQRGRSSLQSTPPRSSTPSVSTPRASGGARPSGGQPSRSGGAGGGRPSGGGGGSGGRGSSGSAPRR